MKEILIIDDDKIILKSIEKQLKDKNYSLKFINDPVIALNELINFKYDLILCDIRMKTISGLDLLRKVKTNYPEIPVIILTGFVDDKMMEEAKKMGCNDFLIKPITKNILLNSINNIFKKDNAV